MESAKSRKEFRNLKSEIRRDLLNGHLEDVPKNIEKIERLSRESKLKEAFGIAKGDILDILFKSFNCREKETRVFAANVISQELIALAESHIILLDEPAKFNVFDKDEIKDSC